jgi:hypothetical protein
VARCKNFDEALAQLSSERGLVRIEAAEREVPATPGLYAIYVDAFGSLPAPFSEELKIRATKLIYVGQASKSLEKRFLQQDLRGKSNATFYRGIGAVLGYRPPAGSLKGKSNQNNYRFSRDDRQEINGWIDRHLLVRWCECSAVKLDDIEPDLIRKWKPLFNTTHNPAPYPPLALLRDECRKIARC